MHSQPRAASSLQIPVDLRILPWMRRLALDYTFDFASLAPFFMGDPSSDAAWRDTIGRTLAHERPRTALADVLAAQQQRRLAPRAAREALDRLRQPGTVAIVTGQQAGLFGGPLYTLLKALTAVRLARRVSEELRTPAVAVFWIDAEDHDWEEVRHCTVLDAGEAPQTVSLPSGYPPGDVPVARVTLDPSIDAVIAALHAALPQTDFSTEVLELVRRTYTAGAGMADAFGRWMEALLGDLGLIVFEASDAAAKPLAAPVFVRELEAPGRTAALAARAGAELVGRGYHAQVTPQTDSVALFHLNDGRRAVRHHNRRFTTGDRELDAASLLREAREHPERFSPNVLLRPIVQDTLFPTVCCVVGPNELAYHAQLRGVYEHFGLPMPLLAARATATLVDSAAARFLTKYDMPFPALQAQDEAALNRLLEAQLPPDVERALQDALAAVERRMAQVISSVPAIDPTLEGAARSTLGRMEHDLRTLHGKIIQASKRRHDTLRRQFVHARAQTFPGGHPQERTLGVAYFLGRYGPGLVDRLAADLPLDPTQHWVLTL